MDEESLKLSLNKSPGSDGLTAEFYRFFWKDIRHLLFKAIQECIERKELLIVYYSILQYLIILIPKQGKHKGLLDNLRPITLLNTDYKLLLGIIAARMKHTNIRLVLDLINYTDICVEKGFIIFLDFYKAFDSVEHPFILEALKHFGFGQKFTNLIIILYNDINSCVFLELFIMVAEWLW